MASNLPRRIGLMLVVFSLALYAAGAVAALQGKFVAAVIVGTMASVGLVVGADLVREE